MRKARSLLSLSFFLVMWDNRAGRDASGGSPSLNSSSSQKRNRCDSALCFNQQIPAAETLDEHTTYVHARTDSYTQPSRWSLYVLMLYLCVEVNTSGFLVLLCFYIITFIFRLLIPKFKIHHMRLYMFGYNLLESRLPPGGESRGNSLCMFTKIALMI